MLLPSVITFAALKILLNLVFMQKSLFGDKSVKCDLTFILIQLSEGLNSFLKIRLVLEIKDVFSFIKAFSY